MLLLTQAATAQVPTSYNLCNKGKIEVRYATAIRSGNFLFGYSWDLVGWYPILPGKCDDAYHGSDKDPDEPIYVAIAFTDSTGVWGAATFPKPDIDTKLCVAEDSFKYHLNGNINLPCKSGYFPFKAALYLEPAEWQCPKMPGQPMYCSGGGYSFDFEVDDDSRAVAAGPSNGKRVAQPNSSGTSKGSSGSSGLTAGEIIAGGVAAVIIGGAIAHYANSTPPKPFDAGTLNANLLGDKIVRRSSGSADWYYDDGSRVEALYGLDGRTRSYILDAPTQRATTDPDVVAAQRALQRALNSFSWSRGITISPEGRLLYTYYAGKNDAGKDFATKVAVNISTLDFARAKRIPPSDGLSQFEIPCKGDEPCAIRLDEDSAGVVSNKHVSYSVTVFFIGNDSGQAAWDALLMLRQLYPAEPAVVAH